MGVVQIQDRTAVCTGIFGSKTDADLVQSEILQMEVPGTETKTHPGACVVCSDTARSDWKRISVLGEIPSCLGTLVNSRTEIHSWPQTQISGHFFFSIPGANFNPGHSVSCLGANREVQTLWLINWVVQPFCI